MQSESEATSAAVETSELTETSAAHKAASTFRGILSGLVGKNIQVINPESYEEAGLQGSRLTTSFYTAKVLGLGVDFLKMQTVLKKSKAGDEPVTQYVPLARIKRISILKTGVLVHL